VATEKQQHHSRRGALRLLAGGLAAGAAVMAGAVGLGFLYPVPKVEIRPRFICLRHQVGGGKTMELLDDAGRKVMLIEKADGELMAIGTVCTHLGCSVFYRPPGSSLSRGAAAGSNGDAKGGQRSALGQFECPCHDGWFDAEGTPTAGPPERPLPRYPVTVRDGKVFVKLA